MSKVKVYELAKELGKDSKDVVKFLEGKNIEVKNHMSTISEDEAAMVKKALGGSKASASGDEAKRSTEEKKYRACIPPAEYQRRFQKWQTSGRASCRWSKGTAECKADAGTERKTGTGKQAGSKICR